MSLDKTNFYYSDSYQRLKLIDGDFDITSSDEDMSEEEDCGSGRNRLSDFFEWEVNDMSYEVILKHLGFSMELEKINKDLDKHENLTLFGKFQ